MLLFQALADPHNVGGWKQVIVDEVNAFVQDGIAAFNVIAATNDFEFILSTEQLSGLFGDASDDDEFMMSSSVGNGTDGDDEDDETNERRSVEEHVTLALLQKSDDAATAPAGVTVTTLADGSLELSGTVATVRAAVGPDGTHRVVVHSDGVTGNVDVAYASAFGTVTQTVQFQPAAGTYSEPVNAPSALDSVIVGGASQNDGNNQTGGGDGTNDNGDESNKALFGLVALAALPLAFLAVKKRSTKMGAKAPMVQQDAGSEMVDAEIGPSSV